MIMNSMSCIDYVVSHPESKEDDKTKKNALIAQLVTARNKTPISPETQALNHTIYDVRLAHSYSPRAAELGMY